MRLLERFTAQTQELVALAHAESRALNHGYIGCEHILLALVHAEKGLAGRMFRSLDVTVERVRARVIRTAGPGAEVTSGEIEFSRQAKKALELSLHESRLLGHHSVASLHILLALLRQEENLRTRTLSLLGTDAKRLARAAEENRARVPSTRPGHLARLMRNQIERQAAIKARDYKRAAALDASACMIRSLMRDDEPGDRVVARVRALLE